MQTEVKDDGAPYSMDMTAEGKAVMGKTPSCLECQKFHVCYIWREMQRVLASNNGPDTDKQKLPIKVDNLAMICSQFYPNARAQTLTP